MSVLDEIVKRFEEGNEEEKKPLEEYIKSAMSYKNRMEELEEENQGDKRKIWSAQKRIQNRNKDIEGLSKEINDFLEQTKKELVKDEFGQILELLRQKKNEEEK
ncbi:hypothetical protein C1646_754148 [Rhizophagus diaphanus]|nr:hypothetical protein C1646_754148 [Rhizophagus diaphanus] [Rhizophagus sp. MUCL 43196]